MLKTKMFDYSDELADEDLSDNYDEEGEYHRAKQLYRSIEHIAC